MFICSKVYVALQPHILTLISLVLKDAFSFPHDQMADVILFYYYSEVCYFPMRLNPSTMYVIIHSQWNLKYIVMLHLETESVLATLDTSLKLMIKLRWILHSAYLSFRPISIIASLSVILEIFKKILFLKDEHLITPYQDNLDSKLCWHTAPRRPYTDNIWIKNCDFYHINTVNVRLVCMLWSSRAVILSG